MRVDPEAALPAEATPSPDEAVRRELADSHRQLRAFLQKHVKDSHEADEVLQSFAIKALSRSWSLRDVQSVRGWLGRVLATTLVDHHRRAGVHRRRDAPETSGAEVSASPPHEVDEAVCDCLHGLLPTLKPEYAEIIRRLDLAGEPRDRLAAEFGTNANNLGVRLYRARKALQGRLEAMCLTCPEHGYFDCRCEDERRRAEIRAGAAQVS
ncbi:MAG: sigma-70 family RNA polymerase sigma factor [Proteobacteria bacterium]|nr:sigma-70 family RNA polymerase sigma factor [Pseudomonadota bacterium]